jgi:hypothetical protein
LIIYFYLNLSLKKQLFEDRINLMVIFSDFIRAKFKNFNFFINFYFLPIINDFFLQQEYYFLDFKFFLSAEKVFSFDNIFLKID